MAITNLGPLFALLATVTFAVSGVLAARGSHIDLFGVVVIGVVTAVGGGTVRDIILDVPVFWLADSTYLITAALAAIAAFFLLDRINRRYTLLLYLDALGVALFASSAIVKTLALGHTGATAAVMGVITGIGGGLIRDVLTGRPTLILSRDLYATPILVGVSVQILWLRLGGDTQLATLAGGVLIFCLRAAAIHFHLQMPAVLTTGLRNTGSGHE